MWMAMPPTICTSKWRWLIARLAGFAHQGKGLHQQDVQRIPLPGPQSQLVRLGLELLEGAPFQLRFERVDSFHDHRIPAQPPRVSRAGKL